MELTSLRYFRAIAAEGHMTRAAERLGVTQSALSAMLKKLEAEVGTELFHRTGRGVELTEAGRVFLRHAEEAIRQAEAGTRAVRELLGLERGSIRVGGGATATTYLLPRAVSEFRRVHPGVRFYVREAGSRAVAESVLAGELDLGIVTLPLDVPGASGVRDLLVMPWVEDELVLITPPKHALSSRARDGARGFAWKDLAGEPVVGFEAGSAVRGVIDRAAGANGVTLNVVMELRSIESIKSMVAAGIGVGLVSRFALRAGDGIACRDGKLGRELAIVRRRDRVPSPAAGVFERMLLGDAEGKARASRRRRRA
ncbi:MAG TPA: LysR family transcriptional regulator [Gemmatimonadales bacterium]|nr:LysR family transcriptional regulator [Gemmatimonadales bacterium]